jgi:Family of unknown function (DUF6481)
MARIAARLTPSSDDFNERLNTAAKARKATLEKFRATASWHR